jgi:hypothetical protein
MEIEYIAQPDVLLGQLLLDHIDIQPTPIKFTLVSAFASLQTVMRLKYPIQKLKLNECEVKIILGLDMGGTTKEVLKEVHTWGISAKIVKNRIPGHTFHPKLYILEWADRAEVMIGSNNLTEGGFFKNYEGSARVKYMFPTDRELYDAGLSQLERFINPIGDISRELNEEYLIALLSRTDIPNEQEAQERRRIQGQRAKRNMEGETELFGFERIPSPPPLSADLLEGLMILKQKQRELRESAEAEPVQIEEQISPSSFYMTLPTLQGGIPGEARIPLGALQLAEEFWGWPLNYRTILSPRRGNNTQYQEWRPIWRIITDAGVTTHEVRMYFVEKNSDFRFYARPLVNAGADLGDIVKITRVSDDEAEFECELARQGTPNHAIWLTFCNVRVKNSTRAYGFN